MNDPGFDTSISNDAKVIENEKQSDERDEVEQDEQAFLAPRYAILQPRFSDFKSPFSFSIVIFAGMGIWLILKCYSRWWFASTAFPLIAGTFGPMASAFSILALAIRWRVYVPPGSVEAFGIYVNDPGWYVRGCGYTSWKYT
jgi:potassium channel subfamily K